MKSFLKWALAPLFLLLLCSPMASCTFMATPTRTTSVAERANLFGIVETVDIALNTAHNLGKIDDARWQTARSQLARIREQIAATETRPVVPGELLQELMAFAAEWVLVEQLKK